MPTAAERFAAVLRRGARLFESAARSVDPKPSPGAPPAYAAGSGIAPGVTLPGVTAYATTPKNLSDRTARALLEPEAYLGRVTYDAGPSLARFSSYPATDLTPEKIAGAQQEAAAGWPLRWEEMIEQILSRDAHLSGIGQQRVDDVVKGSWRLVRSSADDAAACVRSFCDEALRAVDALDDGMAWLLWGNAYCYNACEVVWRRERVTFPGPRGEVIGPIDAVVPARLVAVHPKHFRFDLRTDEPLIWLGSSQLSLPFGKFVFYRGEGQHPIAERRGYMWPCSWLSMFKSQGWAGWAAFVDRFGMPTPLVEYDGTLAQYDEYKRAFEDVLNNLGKGLGAIFPRNAVGIRHLESPQGGRAQDPHSALSDACDAAQSIRVLGATLTAKIGNVGSFAASTTHADVKYAREEADARRLWSTLRSDLLAPMVAFNATELARALEAANYGCPPDSLPRRVPRGMHRVPREVDPAQRMQVVRDAVNELGLRVSAEAMYDAFDLPQPSGDGDVLPGRAESVASGGKLIGAVEAAREGAEAPRSEAVAALPAPTAPTTDLDPDGDDDHEES